MKELYRMTTFHIHITTNNNAVQYESSLNPITYFMILLNRVYFKRLRDNSEYNLTFHRNYRYLSCYYNYITLPMQSTLFLIFCKNGYIDYIKIMIASHNHHNSFSKYIQYDYNLLNTIATNFQILKLVVKNLYMNYASITYIFNALLYHKKYQMIKYLLHSNHKSCYYVRNSIIYHDNNKLIVHYHNLYSSNSREEHYKMDDRLRDIFKNVK